MLAARRRAKVPGFDAAEALLAVAWERMPEGILKVADLEAVPVADASFDVVTGFNVFQFAGDPVRALSGARLRPVRRGHSRFPTRRNCGVLRKRPV